MVAHRFEWTFQPGENRLAVMDYRRGLAVHQTFGAHDGSREGLGDTLMPQAYTQNWDFTCHFAQDSNRNPGLGRSAGARRNHDRVRLDTAGAGDVKRIVAPN